VDGIKKSSQKKFRDEPNTLKPEIKYKKLTVEKTLHPFPLPRLILKQDLFYLIKN